MIPLIKVTLKGVFRDRIFQGIMVMAALFVLIPPAASLSMRQVTELSAVLSLSLISTIMFLLAIFLGSTSVWRDMERRYTFSVITLPIERPAYLVGKFIGISIFLLMISTILGAAAAASIMITSQFSPPDRPILWNIFLLTVLFDSLKYIMLVAVSMLFSAVSTSFFLPIFGSISVFVAGSVSQQVYDYATSPAAAKTLHPAVSKAVVLLYHMIPNFASFDLKVNAIYSILPDFGGLMLTFGYFASYTVIMLSTASLLFIGREMK